MTKITDTVKHLIIINVIIFFAVTALKGSLGDMLAIYYFENPMFKSWQVVTHMFMHANFQHLLFNMIGLWMFGSIIEKLIGRNKFLVLYFVSGIGATLFSQSIDYVQFQSIFHDLQALGLPIDEIRKLYEVRLPLGKGYVNPTYQSIYRIYNTPAVGASGALYGVLVAYGILMPRAKMGFMFLPIMVEARIFIPLLILSDMFFGVFSANTNIGHFAHVGGAIFGFLVIWYYKQKYQDSRYR